MEYDLLVRKAEFKLLCDLLEEELECAQVQSLGGEGCSPISQGGGAGVECDQEGEELEWSVISQWGRLSCSAIFQGG